MGLVTIDDYVDNLLPTAPAISMFDPLGVYPYNTVSISRESNCIDNTTGCKNFTHWNCSLFNGTNKW